MTTHIFYHQETVEEQCAINSWMSIRNNIKSDDEVIILDLGGTLTKLLTFVVKPKLLRYEIIRTDKAEEKSYTFGLNLVMPSAKHKWICLWRSDYIYNKKYFPAVQKGMENSNVVLPYEAFVGADYCKMNWCKNKLNWLINADEQSLMKHSHVCPVYEMMDFAHFAIKRDLWIQMGGMNNSLWGYGWQFPEFFYRLTKEETYNPSIQFDMIAFHQTHIGSFGLGKLSNAKQQELKEGDIKLLKVLGSVKALEEFKKNTYQIPIRPKYNIEKYKPKATSSNYLKIWIKNNLFSLFY